MPNITITERDLTTPGVAAESTDVVYIPGFTVSGADIVAGRPELFTSVTQFNTRCGTVAPVFTSKQDYPDSENDGTSFSASALNGLTGTVMFEAGSVDPSYIMAKELLASGISVLYERVNSAEDSISVETMYTYLSATAYSTSDVSRLVDRGNYSVKYLTSGGYPVYEYAKGDIVTKMLTLAATRGDCVALIDHVDNPKRSIDPNSVDSVFGALNDVGSTVDSDFGSMFTPWITYNRITSDIISDGGKEKRVSPSFRAPGSFAYLTSLADSIKTNANWMAIAGVARGGVLNIADNGMDVIIPNGVADAMQPRSGKVAVNAITNINPYGMTIWGNRTLKKNGDNLVATSFLNVRNLISDIKKTCYKAARKATFEQDTDILWVNFKSDISKLLERMKSGYGISGYKIVRDNNHEKASENATLCAKIIIYPTYAVEDFYITVVLQDDEVSVN